MKKKTPHHPGKEIPISSPIQSRIPSPTPPQDRHLQLAPNLFLLGAVPGLVRALLNVRPEPLDQLLDGDLPVHYGGALALGPARREQHGPEDLHDAVARDAVLDGDALVPVDADADEAVPPRDVDGQALVVEERGEVDVEMSVLAAAGPLTLFLALSLVLVSGARWKDLFLFLALHAVVRVRVQRLVRDDVVLDQRAQVPEALVRVEEEGVGGGAEAREGRVGGGEDGEARPVQVVLVRLVVVVVGDEPRLLGRELEGRELGGE